MFLFFKNTVKKLKFRYTFYQFRKSLQIISIKTTAFMLKIQRSIIIGGAQIITNKRKKTCFYKIIHFSMQFSAKVNRFIVKTYLNSAFTNDLKRNFIFEKCS